MGNSLSELSAPKIPRKLKAKLLKKHDKHNSRLVVDAFMRDLSRSRNCGDINSLIHSYYKLIHRDTIKYDKNELFVDVIEQLNASYSSNGTLLTSNVNGNIQIKSHLSGIPFVKMGVDLTHIYQELLTNPDDLRLSYHKCVDNHYNYKYRDNKDRLAIEFIPLDATLDGPFNVLTYNAHFENINDSRLFINGRPIIMVEYEEINKDKDSIEFKIVATSGYRSHLDANNVEILIPIQPNFHSPTFSKTNGAIGYPSINRCIKWSFKKLFGQQRCELTAAFKILPSNAIRGYQVHMSLIRIKFEIKYFMLTRTSIKYAKVEHLFQDKEKEKYICLPWIRYKTVASDYTIEMGS